MNGHPEPLQSDEVKHIKTELQKIRNQVIHLIDQLEPRTSPPGSRAEGEKGEWTCFQNIVRKFILIVLFTLNLFTFLHVKYIN